MKTLLTTLDTIIIWNEHVQSQTSFLRIPDEISTSLVKISRWNRLLVGFASKATSGSVNTCHFTLRELSLCKLFI